MIWPMIEESGTKHTLRELLTTNLPNIIVQKWGKLGVISVKGCLGEQQTGLVINVKLNLSTNRVQYNVAHVRDGLEVA